MQGLATTEPIPGYAPGTTITHSTFGDIGVHSITGGTGIDGLQCQNHVVFLIKTDVTAIDTWQGLRGPLTDWKAGDILFLPANTELSAKVMNPYSESVIELNDRWLRDTDRMGISIDYSDLRFMGLNSTPISPIGAAVEALASQKVVNLPPMLTEQLNAILAASIAMSLAESARKKICALKKGLSRERKKRVLDYIEANIRRPIGLSELAEVAALSTFHFSRSFRKEVGVSPVRYVAERRVEEAKKMMVAHRELTMTDIAYACGFASPSHFATKFKLACGKSPAAFSKGLAIAAMVLAGGFGEFCNGTIAIALSTF